MIDPTQPSPQARAKVSNRNNLADLRLRYTLAQVEREKTATLSVLNQERMEAMNLLHSIKKRESDKDPTYLKHFRDLTLNARRNLTMSAPAGLQGELDHRHHSRRKKRNKTAELDKARRESIANLHDVNEANVQRLCGRLAEGNHAHTETAHEPKEGDDTQADETSAKDTDTENKTQFVDSVGQSGTDPNQAVMTQVMDLKLTPRRKEPLQKRVATFLEEMDVYKQAKAEAEGAYLNSARMKRQWMLMTKGIDAALAMSSDEDEDEFNTV